MSDNATADAAHDVQLALTEGTHTLTKASITCNTVLGTPAHCLCSRAMCVSPLVKCCNACCSCKETASNSGLNYTQDDKIASLLVHMVDQLSLTCIPAPCACWARVEHNPSLLDTAVKPLPVKAHDSKRSMAYHVAVKPRQGHKSRPTRRCLRCSQAIVNRSVLWLLSVLRSCGKAHLQHPLNIQGPEGLRVELLRLWFLPVRSLCRTQIRLIVCGRLSHCFCKAHQEAVTTEVAFLSKTNCSTPLVAVSEIVYRILRWPLTADVAV